MGHCFVSPLGRAQETASYCIKAVGKTAKTFDWLEEFDAPVDLNRTPELLAAYPNVKPEPPAGTAKNLLTESEAKGFPQGKIPEKSDISGNEIVPGNRIVPGNGNAPGNGDIPGARNFFKEKEVNMPGLYRLRRPWDIGQVYYAGHPELMDPFGWRQSEVYLKSQMPTRYDQVVNAFDQLLASYGYVQENGLYRVERENRETLAFFCHLGVSCVLLSRLWNTSPFFLWQNLAIPTSSITELFTEEREQGSALFRARRIGDVSHLYAGNEPISFACRYCEVYSDFSEETGRH